MGRWGGGAGWTDRGGGRGGRSSITHTRTQHTQHTDMQLHPHAHTNTSTHTHTHAQTQAHTHTRAHTHIHTHTRTNTHTYTHTHTHTHSLCIYCSNATLAESKRTHKGTCSAHLRNSTGRRSSANRRRHGYAGLCELAAAGPMPRAQMPTRLLVLLRTAENVPP